MKKIIYLLSILLFTGCTATYNLEINNGKFKENISSTFDYNELDEGEKATLSSLDNYSVNAFYNSTNDEINIDMVQNDNIINLSANYEYTENNFNDAYLINSCFDNHIFYSDSNNYYIKLSGDFKCQYAPSINIIVKTDYKVLSTNASNKNGNYTWTLTNNNNKDVDMYIQISKLEKKTRIFSLTRIIIFIVIIILSIITYLLYKKRENNKKN